ncbi:hypothetical protein [Janibacter sp. GS2]|uniref:hypothetical protein n=1 Tax=Janibacter sp. GS2 TaxID=3442646 RepID=UPI003EBE0038
MDIRIDNPVGRVPDPRTLMARTLDLSPAGWRLGRHRGTWDSGLNRHLCALDNAHQLRVGGEGAPHAARDQVADFLQRAIARGTFVHGDLGTDLTTALPPELAAQITTDPTGRPGDLDWDVQSVRQRRAVLQPLVARWPTVSLVLVSRRGDRVAAMVKRLSTLDYPELEIVVGLHGVPAPSGLSEVAGSRSLVVREFPADQVFGSVINDAFACASGELVGKVDDDDFFGDPHLMDLVMAHGYSRATLVGKSTTVIFLEAIDTTVRRLHGVRESFTDRVAGSTFLMTPEDLADVGGWPSVPRAVDTHLINAIRRESGTIYQPHDIGYLYVRNADPSEHTWGTGGDHFLRNTREQWIGLLRHPEFGTEGEA